MTSFGRFPSFPYVRGGVVKAKPEQDTIPHRSPTCGEGLSSMPRTAVFFLSFPYVRGGVMGIKISKADYENRSPTCGEGL